jgi:hypothetical protein
VIGKGKVTEEERRKEKGLKEGVSDSCREGEN